MQWICDTLLQEIEKLLSLDKVVPCKYMKKMCKAGSISYCIKKNKTTKLVSLWKTFVFSWKHAFLSEAMHKSEKQNHSGFLYPLVLAILI